YDNNNSNSDGRTDLVASTVYLLGATLPYAHRFANEDADEPLPMMDLSEACLLAVGSMCGASTGCFANDSVVDSSIFGEIQQDQYSHLRQDASTMACEALTTTKNRGALLPSLLIGALGESLVVPVLRLTLSIAQNHHEVRGELARSGMLVPVGDILQHSLSSGERYTFSVAIAILRFCGPCCRVESSAAGSIASLQNAIRTLACVLMISESGDDNLNDPRRKTLLSLKFESLLALEALSSNEALSSTMLADAFPALNEFLIQLDGRMDSSTEIDIDELVCSALKTIQSIISLPSSASSTSAVKGVISSLVKILNETHCEKADKRKQEVSLQLLHSIALGKNDAVVNGGFLSSGVLESVASLLGQGGISANLTLMGLEIVEAILVAIDCGIDHDDSTISSQFNSPAGDTMLQFIDVIAGQEQFLRALIATMIGATMIDKKDINLYGKPLVLPGDASNGPRHAEIKAINALFNISSLLCSDDSGVGKEHFLHAFMLKGARGAVETVAFAASTFLQVLMDEENGICVPRNPANRSFFLDVKLPIVRSYLLEGLNSSLDECMSSNSSRKKMESLICDFKIPQMCLLFCQSKTVSQAAFEVYENVVLHLPIDVIGDLLLADRSSLVALFDLVTGQNNLCPDFEHSKQTFALTLGNLAKAGFLSDAVERFGVRNNAIAALSAAMQGSDDDNIDENEDSLPRICVESLAAILYNNQQERLEVTVLEAQTMATAIGKILSKTVLNRFFTQASLEATFEDSMDHSSDRSAISQSAEARLLCSMATYPETLEILRKVGGLEAIGLIAHEGELAAIRAIQTACELNPGYIVDVDCHLSIMDALIQVESKLSIDRLDVINLREVATKCIEIITSLSRSKETMAALTSSEQSFSCLTAAACIISASSKSLSETPKAAEKVIASVDKGGEQAAESFMEKDTISPTENKEETTEVLHLGDMVIVDSAQLPPSKSSQARVEHLEGIVSHLGPVQFAPGSDWIGIRLTGSSVGKGRNDGSVKGHRYFCCENDESGVFVKKDNVKRRTNEVGSEAQKETITQAEVATENTMSLVDTQQEQLWRRLLVKDDFILERAAFSLMLSFSSSKSHRDLLMTMETLINDMTNVIQLQSPALIDFQCKALDLLVSFTFHLHKTDAELTKLLCSVIESRTRSLQTTRDKKEQLGSKQLLCLALSGLQNMFGSFMSADEKSMSLKIASGLFVFLVDSLYKGPRSRRLATPTKDTMLFYHLSSFFVLSLGSERLRASILSTRFVSSLVRFIMMTSGVPSFDRSIPITEKEQGGEYWSAALSHCLYSLSDNMIESAQDHLGISFVCLIDNIEAPPKSFQMCLKHIADKLSGVSSISAKQILAKLDRLPG
ncbi:hypothetical protein ACHAXR_009278, partial [Thalassiosira sp. AJA248-18]